MIWNGLERFGETEVFFCLARNLVQLCALAVTSLFKCWNNDCLLCLFSVNSHCP